MPCLLIWRRMIHTLLLFSVRWVLIALIVLGYWLTQHWHTPPLVYAQTIPAAQLFLPLVLDDSPPLPDYEFNVGIVERCDPNAGVTYVNGTTAKDGVAVNGAFVAFSYAPDGPIVAKIASGPHAGYPNWPSGFFSHILGVGGPRQGDWYFWVVDAQDQRISVIIFLHTDGQAGEGKCQQGVLRFDHQAAMSQ